MVRPISLIRNFFRRGENLNICEEFINITNYHRTGSRMAITIIESLFEISAKRELVGRLVNLILSYCSHLSFGLVLANLHDLHKFLLATLELEYIKILQLSSNNFLFALSPHF